MKKGDIVRARGYAKGKVTINGTIRMYAEFALDKPIEGVLLGYSFICSGLYDRRYSVYDDYEMFDGFVVKEKHKVWLMEPFTHGDRYIEPLRVPEYLLDVL